jgi:hypothetical protein
MRRGFLLSAILAPMLMLPMLARGDLELRETSTKTTGATTINWDSSFHDSDYTCGSPISATVTWSIVSGNAQYPDTGFFGLRRFTPRSKRHPADGAVLSRPTQAGNAVDFEFAFCDLHFDSENNVDVGNAHFKLYLIVDEDGNGTPESLVGYGVNFHVEDINPQRCTGCE